MERGNRAAIVSVNFCEYETAGTAISIAVEADNEVALQTETV